MSDHSTLTGLNLHQPWHYIQETDPGAVGAELTWFKKSTKEFKYRDDTNASWITIMVSAPAGDEISTYHQVPPGSSWSAFLTIYNAAASGDTVVLPNEAIIQTATLQITKDIKIIGHAGGLSELRINGNVALYGTGAQFYIGWDFSQYPTEGPPADPAINVVLRGFIMSHSRAVSTTRVSALQLHNGIASLEVAYMRFEDITADVVTQSGSSAGTDLDCHNVSFHDNVIDEWYESVFISRNGSLTGCWIYNNTCTTTAPNPDGGISRPYGFIIDEEGSTGFRGEFVVANNILDASGASYLVMGNSLGLSCTINSSSGSVCFNRVSFVNNYVYNFFYGIYMNGVSNLPARTAGRTSFISFESNRLENSISSPVYIGMQADDDGPLAGANDRLILAHNHCENGGGPGGVGGITIDITATPAYIVNSIGNTSSGV